MHRRRDGIVAKNKVINTVLTVRDNMSGGLVKAAQNAKKSGKAIDSSMISATRSVVAFKNKSVAALQDYAKKAGAAIVAGTTAVATGLSALTLKSALAADDLNTLAKQSGFSTADIQKWQYASDLIDVSIDDIVKSAAKMKKNMISTSKTTIAAWDQLGIKVKDSNGHLRNSTTVFYETLTALSKVQNETERDTLAMTLFGKSADSLAGIVDDGGAALQELAGKAEKAGVILSQDTLDSANALNDKVDTLKATVKGFAGKVGSELAGRASKALDVVGSHFSKAFNAKPMDWLNGKLDTLMAKLDSWIAGGGLERLADLLVNGVQLGAQKAGDMLQKAGDALKWCKDHSDTLVNVLKGLAAAWAIKKVLDFNNGLADCVGNIGGIIKTVLTMTGVLGGQAAATGTATVAQTGLNAAMAANPIGAVILAIEALIAVGVLLYKHWDTIKAGAQSLWNKFKDVSIRIGTAFSGAFNKVKNAAKTALEWVGDKLSWLNDKIESIPILGSLYKGAKGALGTAVEWVDNATTGNRSGTSTGTTQTKTSSKTTTTAGPVKTTTSTTTTVPKPTPSSLLSLPGLGKATGTPYWRGGLTRVNERGGEIMNLPSGTQIIPHDVSVKAAGGRSVTVNVTIQGNVIGNREYTEQVGEYVGRKVLAALGNT
nr:MAG TPA: tail tape measure [Caudoviricetes sp.]